MREIETAAAFAISQTKNRNLAEVGPDELLLGCLQAVAQFGIVQLGALTLDLEELGINWLQTPGVNGAKVAYSQTVVGLFDQAARIARAEGGGPLRVDHLLAAFAGEETGLMGDLKRRYEITNASWRAAVAQLSFAPGHGVDAMRGDANGKDGQGRGGLQAGWRDYLTPEEAADALGIHVQTLRGYVRSGKLPALRLAGERAIRIRRTDLEKVLEPLIPQGESLATQSGTGPLQEQTN